MYAYATNRKKQVNQIHFSELVRWIAVAVFVGFCGLLFVYNKNQQFALGDKIRQVERETKEIRADNQVQEAQISLLSSRVALQKRLADGTVHLKPIEGADIARLNAPTFIATADMERTAANERFRP
jgi:cell division protein FtsB